MNHPSLSVLVRVSSLLAFLGAVPATAGSPPANPPYQANFPVMLDGTQVRRSSIALGDLNQDGVPEIVVGGADGKVHAYRGDGMPFWDPPFDTGDMEIEAKAVIADLDGDGDNEVVIGAGSTFTPEAHGDLFVLDHLGNFVCSFETLDTFGAGGWRDGVASPAAVADLVPGDGGQLEIAFGSFDRRVRVITHECALVWEENVFDSVFGSPAIGDVDRDGDLDVVIGTDADADSPGSATDGGLLHVWDGATGVVIAGFPKQVDEVIWSSPALGDLTGDGWLEIVVGTGYCWADPECPTPRDHPGVGQYLNAWDHEGNPLPGWPVTLPRPPVAGAHRYAFASPALADVDNDGRLEVIINAKDGVDKQEGQVYVLNADGSDVPGWPKRPTLPASPTTFSHFNTAASPIVADVTGDGNLEVILPSNWDLVVWDKDGNQLSRDASPPPAGDLQLRTNRPLASSAAVGDIDGDGDLEVVVGGYWETSDPTNAGAIYAWDFAAAASARQPWPMFRRSADNRALEGTTIFIDGFESGDVSFWSN